MLIIVVIGKPHLAKHVTETRQHDLDSLFNISDSQSEQVPSNGNFKKGWVMIKVMND